MMIDPIQNERFFIVTSFGPHARQSSHAGLTEL